MKNKGLFAIALLATAALVLSPAASWAANAPATLKIGVYDLQKVIMDSKAGKAARADFQKALTDKQAAVSKLETEVKAMQDDLSKVQKGDDVAKKAKQTLMENKIREYNNMRMNSEGELRKKDEELTKGIIKNVLAIVDDIGKKEGFSIILQKAPAVSFAEPTMDITSKVLEQYDALPAK